MNIHEIYSKALGQIRQEVETSYVNEFKTLLEKRSKAKLLLDNIDREIEDKKLELAAKVDATMSCELPGIQSERP